MHRTVLCGTDYDSKQCLKFGSNNAYYLINGNSLQLMFPSNGSGVFFCFVQMPFIPYGYENKAKLFTTSRLCVRACRCVCMLLTSVNYKIDNIFFVCLNMASIGIPRNNFFFPGMTRVSEFVHERHLIIFNIISITILT